MARPALNTKISLEDFQNYYWLKQELVKFCKEVNIPCSRGKIEITDAIILFLETGRIEVKPKTKEKRTSNFDWRKANLSRTTVITDNYSNTENVRSFFKESIGVQFKFSVEFMNWMKANTGKSLDDAVQKWTELAKRKSDADYKTIIAPQFEYNSYIRAFLLDNPTLSIKHAIENWKLKKLKPGPVIYQSEDIINK